MSDRGRGAGLRDGSGAAGRPEPRRRPDRAGHRHRRRLARRHRRSGRESQRQRVPAPRRTGVVDRSAQFRPGKTDLHRRGPCALSGSRHAPDRGPRQGRPEQGHPRAGRHQVPAGPSPRQRRRPAHRHAGQPGLAVRVDVFHLPARGAPLGTARPAYRRGHRGGHGHRPQRDPARRQHSGAVPAVVPVPDRRPPPHRSAVPGHLLVGTQRLRLAPADLSEPGAELRRHHQPAVDEQTRPATGRRIPLSHRNRQRRAGCRVPAVGQTDRPRTRQRDRRRRAGGEPPGVRSRLSPLQRRPGLRPALAGAQQYRLDQRHALPG